MSEFLVEAYVSRVGPRSGPAVADVSHAAAELTAEGRPVRFLRSIFLPEDETCFFLFRAISIDTVREVVRRAGLEFERISEAVSQRTTIEEEAS